MKTSNLYKTGQRQNFRFQNGYSAQIEEVFFNRICYAFSGITNVHCKLSCSSCRKSFPHCDYSTGVCDSNCRRTKLCKREDDLCLASWSRKRNKLVMYTSCFRLPPFSNSSQYNANCKAEILNGTRTCLCRGSGCNRTPSEPVMERKQWIPNSEKPKQIQVRQKREYGILKPHPYAL